MSAFEGLVLLGLGVLICAQPRTELGIFDMLVGLGLTAIGIGAVVVAAWS